MPYTACICWAIRGFSTRPCFKVLHLCYIDAVRNMPHSSACLSWSVPRQTALIVYAADVRKLSNRQLMRSLVNAPQLTSLNMQNQPDLIDDTIRVVRQHPRRKSDACRSLATVSRAAVFHCSLRYQPSDILLMFVRHGAVPSASLIHCWMSSCMADFVASGSVTASWIQHTAALQL